MSHTGILDRNLTIAQAFDAEGGIYFRQRRSTRAPARTLPGFGLAMGVTLVYLSLIVLIPLSATFVMTAQLGVRELLSVIGSPRVLSSLRLTFSAALAAALIDALFGLLLAWVLTRYAFPGRRVMNALIDLPFALPTAVAGIALTGLLAGKGWIGAWLAAHDLQVAFTPLGIVVALTFVGLPFVVRTVQPVLSSLAPEFEEAAQTLGASRLQAFTRVVFPALLPALLTGFALSLARGIGEYGSVIFIAGNIPMVSEIAPLLIVTKLEQYDYPGAAAIASVMLVASFALLLAINALQAWTARHRRDTQ
jgi:sulfate transport system permease protein